MKPYLHHRCALRRARRRHFARTVAEWSRLAADPGFIVEGPGIGLVAALLSIWAWRLLRATAATRGAA